MSEIIDVIPTEVVEEAMEEMTQVSQSVEFISVLAGIFDSEKFDISQINVSHDQTVGLVVATEKETKANVAILADLEVTEEKATVTNNRLVHIEHEPTMTAVLSPSGKTIVLLTAFDARPEKTDLEIRYSIFIKNEDWEMLRNTVVKGNEFVISDQIHSEDMATSDLVVFSKEQEKIELKISVLDRQE